MGSLAFYDLAISPDLSIFDPQTAHKGSYAKCLTKYDTIDTDSLTDLDVFAWIPLPSSGYLNSRPLPSPPSVFFLPLGIPVQG